MTDVAVLAVGPGGLRSVRDGRHGGRLPDELAEAMGDGPDDDVLLVGDRPVAAGEAWQEALELVTGGSVELAVLVYPSWWPPRRAAVVEQAAGAMAADVVMLPRSQALAQAVPGRAGPVVEIAPDLVAITRPLDHAGPRPVWALAREDGDLAEMAEQLAAEILARHPESGPVVLDGADGVPGAAELSAKVTGLLPGLAVIVVSEDRLLDAVATRYRRAERAEPVRPRSPARPRPRRLGLAAGVAAAAILAAAAIAAGSPPPPAAPTTVLYQGRIAVTVPAGWTAYRVVAGPGSVRVQVDAPADRGAALHITQSGVAAGDGLPEIARVLRSALAAEAPGVFTDFNPADRLGGRAVVTYRELRADYAVRWTVFVDGRTRIGIGCQSRYGGIDLVWDACVQAVASARESSGTDRRARQSND